MLKVKKYMIRIISVILALTMVMLSACESTTTNATLSDPNSNVIVENVESEHILTEDILYEHITDEIYLNEILIAENKITELLLNEKEIDEVILCKTIYVSQDNIDEFAKNSQTSSLFGGNVNIKALLTKISIGTGVIVTLVVLKKVGIPEPIASVVVAAADKSVEFAASGALVGSLFGGLTGAADTVDESKRTSAVLGFALATAGLVISIVSLVAAIPSGGSTTITAAAGVKLVIAGIGVIGATAGISVEGYNAVKTFTSTDSIDIDWENIDWKKAGVASAEQAINYGVDGYIWGSIIGAVYGGPDGYEFYQKYNTPYSAYNSRLAQTPIDDEFGHWTGVRGESDYIYDKSKTIRISKDRYVTVEAGKKVQYQNCVPDFSPFQEAQVKIPRMTENRTKNFKQADEELAKYWTKIKHDGKTWTADAVNEYRTRNGLTWHEMNNMNSMQLVPTEVNAGFGHLGGVGEYNAMIGEKGVTEFD